MIHKKAFSLIELMVVLTILAITTTVAIPIYKNYVNKAKVTAMLALVEPCVNQVYQYFFKNGSLPDGSGTGQTISCQGEILNNTLGTWKDKVSAAYSYNFSASGGPIFQIRLAHADLKTRANVLYEMNIQLQIQSSGTAAGEIIYTCNRGTFPPEIVPSTCIP